MTLLDAAHAPLPAQQPATVSVTVNGHLVQAEPAGVFTIPWTAARRDAYLTGIRRGRQRGRDGQLAVSPAAQAS